ncbi:hypothetical protein SeMB42_g00378 [Synchytrium endobioticum]|uniref:Nuclear distribution protein PAC1 n=1 Tax=Synchytrium endobioticum TaxID=286115 RepID=A0A507DDY2_9FUNG|nr:hypothetical protein SeLEV6574_g01282 [Synchytrium endobioticum]TPX54299.1 hypothetical protein SeMB42_g00378 [Synchytrium endobioticum]
MSILTSKQQEELRYAILDYLNSAGLSASFQTLKQECALDDYVADGKQKYSGLLVKKWTSVLRLQKKIMDLETRTHQLQEEVAAGPVRKANGTTDWLPRPPEKLILTGHRSPITRIAFHPVFTIIASASEDATVKMWDTESGEFERTLKGHTKAVHDLCFDAKGSYLVTCSADLSVKLWDANADYKCIKTLHGHDHSVSSVTFSISGDMIISASRDKTIRMWETSTGFCVRTLSGHLDWVRAVRPSLDGKLLVSCSNDQTIRIWDLTTGECKSELRGHEHVVEDAVFIPIAAHSAVMELTVGEVTSTVDQPTEGRYVVSGSRDKSIRIWDVATGQCIHTFNGHDNWVRGLALHPAGKHLISASDDKTLRIWDLKTGRNIKTVDAHPHFVTCIDLNANSHLVATGSVDQTVKIWTCS